MLGNLIEQQIFVVYVLAVSALRSPWFWSVSSLP